MKNNNAFRRAKEMMAKIQHIVVQSASPLLANILIQQLGEYKSRGHGGVHTARAKYGFAFTQHKRINRKHVPHQGAQEIARRLRHNDWGFQNYVAR